MEIKIKKNELVQGVNYAEKAISSKNINRILYGFYLSTDNNLTIKATDLEISIETVVDCEVLKKGDIVVNSAYFSDIVRRLPEDEVFLNCEGNILHIESGYAKFELMILESEEYPKFPDIKDSEYFEIDCKNFKRAIEMTHVYTSIDDSRPTLKGVYFDIKDKLITFVGLDGYRLAYYTADISNNMDKSLIVPANSLRELVKILPEEGNIKVIPSLNHIVFSFGSTVVYSRLIQGNYFDYGKILNKDFTNRATINKNLLKSAVERASIMNREGQTQAVRFTFNNDELLVELKGKHGDMNDKISIKSETEDLKIGFNPKFLLQALSFFKNEEVYMDFIDSLNPCIFRDPEDSAFLHLILPVRLGQ